MLLGAGLLANKQAVAAHCWRMKLLANAVAYL